MTQRCHSYYWNDMWMFCYALGATLYAGMYTVLTMFL